MRAIAYDTETHRFRAGLQNPPLVCLQYCEVTPQGLGPSHVVLRDEGLALLWEWTGDPDLMLIGAELAYDVLSPVATAGKHGPELLRRFVSKYDADLMSDVFVRQKLIDLARGCYRFERNEAGATIGVNEYNLADLAWRHAKMDLNKDTYWRLNYHELDNVPLDRWPAEALQYARDDATATGLVWLAQWRSSSRIRLNFPGRDTTDALKDEFRQARAALWLKAMSSYGLRTDPKAVALFAEYIQEDYTATVTELIAAGLARREFHVHREEAIRYISTKPELVALCTKAKRAGPPQFVLGRDQRQALANADPALWCLVDPNATQEISIELGIATMTEHRNTKAAAARMAAWHQHNGTKPALTKTGILKEKRHEPIADGECIALDKDACLSTGDEVLTLYAEMVHLSKVLSTDIKHLKDGEFLPIHTRYEGILETGRTSSSKPNVQNQARGVKSRCKPCARLPKPDPNCEACHGKGKIDRIGARECFVPRQGYVLIDSDYGKLELHAVAQVCIWAFGFSKLGEVLNRGEDPHTAVAAEIEEISYAAGLALEEAGDYGFLNTRNAAKPVNFGKWGGIGPDTMRGYSAKGYGIVKPREFWVGVIETWNRTWPEAKTYFRMIESLKAYPGAGTFNVVQPWSGRLRAGASYCAAANTFFQGLGADVAKLAGWFIFKACYCDPSSPLYGARPVLFVHDQFLIEVLDNANASRAAAEVQRLMNLAGQIVLPDCPVKCKPLLARRYSKGAKRIVGKDGALTAWEDMRLAA